MAAGGIVEAIELARMNSPELMVEVEVESLEELEQALTTDVDRIMLDNFDLEQMRKAVAINASRTQLEASGNVNLDTIRAIAETGVDYISTGNLTKDLKSIDLSMRFS